MSDPRQIVAVWALTSAGAARRWPRLDHEDAVGWVLTTWLAAGAPCPRGPIVTAAGLVRRAGELMHPGSRRARASWVQPIAARLEARGDGRGLAPGQSPSGEPWREDLEALAGVRRGELARSLGVSAEALRLWARGDRTPGPASRAALAAARAALTRPPRSPRLNATPCHTQR